jgi:hypothetical protein
MTYISRLTGSLRIVLVVALLCRAGSVWAQDRSRMTVYVPLPTGGVTAQQVYFQESFKTELIGANYPVVESREVSVFTLFLEIEDNPYFDQSQQVDGNNQRYMVNIRLERSVDNVELVSFGFPFNDTESLSDWSLFLLYQAMANAVLPEENNTKKPKPAAAPLPPEEQWRGKQLYISGGLGLDMGYFVRPGTLVADMGFVMPSAALSLEWHFWSYLSLEAVLLKARFMHDQQRFLFTPGFAALFKAVVTPGAFMLEPYGGAEYSLAVPSAPIPRLSVLAGVQAGVRGGRKTAITADFGISYSLMGGMSLFGGENPYSALRFTLLTGVKTGFGDLKR